jgi:hypothetical protein
MRTRRISCREVQNQVAGCVVVGTAGLALQREGEDMYEGVDEVGQTPEQGLKAGNGRQDPTGAVRPSADGPEQQLRTIADACRILGAMSGDIAAFLEHSGLYVSPEAKKVIRVLRSVRKNLGKVAEAAERAQEDIKETPEIFSKYSFFRKAPSALREIATVLTNFWCRQADRLKELMAQTRPDDGQDA